MKHPLTLLGLLVSATPLLVVPVPLVGLTAKAYAKELVAKIARDKSLPSATAGDPSKLKSGSTTSFSVMDKNGTMVTITKSINYFFGSCALIPGTGFIMNDPMDDFVLKPGSVNSIAPGTRPLSSMSPTVAQVISNVINFGMPLQEAILAPRYFQMASGNLNVEGRVSLNTFNQLTLLGHVLTIRNDWDGCFGRWHELLMGVSDPRRHGPAAAF